MRGSHGEELSHEGVVSGVFRGDHRGFCFSPFYGQGLFESQIETGIVVKSVLQESLS